MTISSVCEADEECRTRPNKAAKIVTSSYLRKSHLPVKNDGWKILSIN